MTELKHFWPITNEGTPHQHTKYGSCFSFSVCNDEPQQSPFSVYEGPSYGAWEPQKSGKLFGSALNIMQITEDREQVLLCKHN